MVEQKTAQLIKEKLGQANKVLVLGHANPRPDGDSLGAVLAMADYLENIGQRHTVFNGYPAEKSLQFLPRVNRYQTNPEEINILEHDLVLMLDFGDFNNSGLAKELSQAKDHGVYFIQIDHHPLKNEAADLAVVLAEASSTCEILCYWFRQLGIELTADMATALLTGLLMDTQHFTNLATTSAALEAGSDLLKYGADIDLITRQIWQNKELSTLRLWGKIFMRLVSDPQTGIASTAITLADLEEEGLNITAVEGFASFLNSLDQAKAIVVLTEAEGGIVKGSLRTTRDDIDVAKMAKVYSGGGHKKSAGFLTPGKIIQTERGWRIKKQ